jgi:hypothetical protein
MASVAYYRAEAQRCRELAAAAKDDALAGQWRKLARDYEALAESLEGRSGMPPPAVHVPMQQPVQQQQSKIKPDDK